MTNNQFLDHLFGHGAHNITIQGHFIHGNATVDGKPVQVIGTWDKAALDCELALAIADAVLQCVEEGLKSQQPRPIVFIADTQGQALSRHDELLGLNGYFAHVAHCVGLARRHGHKTMTLIHGEAVSGGFLAFGLLADRICALPNAQVRVMDLRAMARVTKIPLEKLELLAQDSPVFAPGADNYWRMGAIHDIWPDHGWSEQLKATLATIETTEKPDCRADLGLSRGGRLLASNIASLIVDA